MDNVNHNKDPAIKSRHDIVDYPKPFSPQNDGQNNSNVIFNPEDLIGRSFMINTCNDGTFSQAQVVKLIEDHESKTDDNPSKLKFLLSVNEDKAEEIVSYNKLLVYIAKDDTSGHRMEIPKDCIASRTSKERSS
jgi:hypothetical protein